MTIHLRRAYEPPSHSDGYRVLVDRVWPRGLTRQALQIDAWLKDLAPSTALRQWFAHDPGKWAGFKHRYFTELNDNPEIINSLIQRARSGRLTLVYAAKNEKFNNAIALKEYIESRIHQC